MSKMLEQAIVDAAALREAALKNAEQSIIEKYAPQIKEAVEAMLENETAPTNTRTYQGRSVTVIHEADEDGNVTVSEDNGKPFVVSESELTESDVLQEEEAQVADSAPSEASIEAPPAWDSRYSETQSVTLSAMLDNVDEDGNIEIDLDSIELALTGEETEATQEAENDLSLAPEEEEVEAPTEENEDAIDALFDDENEEDQLQEVIDMIKGILEEEILEEEIEVDMGAAKTGTFETNQATLQYEADKEAAKDAHEGEEEEEEKEDTLGQVNDLHETITSLKSHNEKLEDVVNKMNDKLEETLLSNAILLYQNRTLNDASLNERQKSKIVEAIGNAESPKEAKNLHETLKATVGSESNKGPQSLSESVNRKSNLSSMLNRRQNLNERKDSDDSFMKKMQKLAGIK